MIRLYGPRSGGSSFVQVATGIRTALEAHGVLAGYYGVDFADDDAENAQDGAGAPIAICTGSPLRAIHAAHRRGRHQQIWLVLAPNSGGVPAGLRRFILQVGVHGLIAPSAWAAEVLLRSFGGKLPVLLAPHGVDPEIYRPDSAIHKERVRDYQDGAFRVLHVTSTAAERKATRELCAAWALCMKRGSLPLGSMLAISANPLAVPEIMQMVQGAGCTQVLGDPGFVRVAPGFGFSSEQMAGVYRHAHLICQPSRGEGFGLVPLEARACGTPVVMTDCTGHEEQLSDPDFSGVIVVETGPEGPIDDYLGAVAPTVDPLAIAKGLEAAHKLWSTLGALAMQQAPDLGKSWSWASVMADAINQLKDGIKK